MRDCAGFELRCAPAVGEIRGSFGDARGLQLRRIAGTGADRVHARPMPIRATSSDPRRLQLRRIAGTGADRVHARPMPIRATSSDPRRLQSRRITETGANPTALRGLTNAAECWNRRGWGSRSAHADPRDFQ
ncbi:hypothetical protein [Rhodococcoides kroppenstedtii]|uniref:hypothetical protein n=1 Tax=Rhodococcoides kroppenstedtii TaxID=293050 RepID=UPI00363A845B